MSFWRKIVGENGVYRKKQFSKQPIRIIINMNSLENNDVIGGCLTLD